MSPRVPDQASSVPGFRPWSLDPLVGPLQEYFEDGPASGTAGELRNFIQERLLPHLQKSLWGEGLDAVGVADRVAQALRLGRVRRLGVSGAPRLLAAEGVSVERLEFGQVLLQGIMEAWG